jgi:hypothetical protein
MVGVTYRFVVVHNWYSTLFAMLAIYAAVRVVETGSRTWAFIAGALAAATVLIEQSKGAGLCLGLLLGYVVLHLLRPVKTEFRLGAFVVGFIGPCVVTAVCFTSHHAFGIMLKDWFWPLQHYTQANRVFYGHLSWSDGVRNNLYTGPIAIRISEIITLSPLLIVPVLPLAGVAWLAWWIKQVWRGGDRSGEAAHYVLVSACAAGMLLCILVVRTDITDFMYLAPLWFVILAFLLTRRATRFRLLARLRPFALAYICLSFSALGFGLLLSVNGATVKTHARRGVIFTANEEHTVPAIQTAIPPGGQLLVYPYLPLYNYLTETTSPATLDFFQPGMNTLDQAQGMVQALEESQTAWVLFDPEFVTKITDVWPHTELKTIVEDPVGVYLAQHYRICQILRAGPGLSFQLMTLKDRPCGSVTVSSPMKPVNKSTHVRRPLFSKS